LRPPLVPKKSVRIRSPNYLVRTIVEGDASERWASWMTDPEAIHMLNLAPRAWSKADIVRYIAGFDQRQSLLLGIFEKADGTHIGIMTIDINVVTRQFLINMLIGDADQRHKGVTAEITVPFRDYFFETLGLETALASVLARNAPIIAYLHKTGWQLDRTLPRGAKSNAGGEPLDLCLFNLSREAWRAWKKAHAAGG
jgi:RimJ/RimL family protein N-acetyltransferase